MSNRRPQKPKGYTPKTRYHKVLFDKDAPFGHKVQKDRTKTLPRKEKYPDTYMRDSE
jgi:hypothetical protein